MRKGRDGGEKKRGKKREKKEKREKTDENSGHYVIASSRPPKRRTPTAGTPHARAKISTLRAAVKILR